VFTRPPGDGNVRDTAYYSITDHEWPSIKDRLVSRLEDLEIHGT
jgi:hypothetical protein